MLSTRIPRAHCPTKYHVSLRSHTQPPFPKNAANQVLLNLIPPPGRAPSTLNSKPLTFCAPQVETPAHGITFPPTQVILRSIPAAGDHPGTLVRLAGDRYVMVEYGPMELDLNLRVRVWALEKYLKDQKVQFQQPPELYPGG